MWHWNFITVAEGEEWMQVWLIKRVTAGVANERRLNAGKTEGGLREVWPGWEVRMLIMTTYCSFFWTSAIYVQLECFSVYNDFGDQRHQLHQSSLLPEQITPP